MARATRASTFEEKMADPYYDWSQESTNLGNDVVASAKSMVEKLQPGRGSVLGDYERDQNIAQSRAIEERGPDYTLGDVAYDTAAGAAIPASFLTGPVGLVAGGALALDSLRNTIKDPSLTNIGTTALGALPFLRMGRAASAGRAASEAKPLEVITSSIDDLTAGAKGAGKKGFAPHAGANEGRAAQFQDVLSRQPKSQPGMTTFDMTGAPGTRVATNTATDIPYVSPNAGGRLGARGPGSVEDVAEDALFDMAGDPSTQESIAALRAATMSGRPAAGMTGNLPSLGRGVTQVANPMTLQTPQMLDAAAETVSAPGFSLGRVTPLSEVPTSKAAIESMRARTAPLAQVAKEAPVKRMPPRMATPDDSVSGFSDLSEDDILQALENGYEYGAGIPARIGRVR